MTRCLFGRLNGILLHEGASHNKIGWNSFKDMPYYENEHKNAIRCDFRPTDPRFMTGNHIYRNYFTTAFAASDASAATETPTVYLGLSKAFSEPYPDTGFLVEHNLFVGIDYKSSVRVKADGNVIRFNTSIGPGSVSGAKNRAQFGQRHGERNKWYGNWAENTRGFKVNEHNQELLGNKAVGAATIDLNAGSDDNKEACSHSLLVGNEGTCYVGNRDFPEAVTELCVGNRIEAHKPGPSSVVLTAYQRDTTVAAAASRAFPQPVRLTVAEVGADAP